MDERSLHALLEHAAEEEPPLGQLVDISMREGRKLRLRRQVLGALVCAAAVAAAGLAPVAYSSIRSAGHGQHRLASGGGLARSTAYVMTTAGVLVPINLTTSKAGPPLYRFHQVGGGVTQLVMSRDGRTAYASTDGGTIVPIDTRTGRAGRAITVPSLTRMADTLVITPDGSTALAVESTRGITPVDLATGAAGRQVKVPGATPAIQNIAITPDSRTAYVIGPASRGSRHVVVTPVGIATGRPSTPIILGSQGTPGGIAISPDGRTAYVVTATGSGRDVVTSIDTATNTIRKAITVPGGYGGLSGIVAAPGGRTVYVLSGSDVFPVSAATNRALKPITIPEWAAGTDIAIDPDGKRAYVLSSVTATVTPIDLADRTVLQPITFPQPDGVEFIAFSPNGRTAYIGVSVADTLVPLQTATGKLGAPIHLLGSPTTIVFGG
jgi:hyaluronoglucosaminidase